MCIHHGTWRRWCVCVHVCVNMFVGACVEREIVKDVWSRICISQFSFYLISFSYELSEFDIRKTLSVTNIVSVDV